MSKSTGDLDLWIPSCDEAKEGPGMRLLDPTVFVLGETAHMRLPGTAASTAAETNVFRTKIGWENLNSSHVS